MTDWLNWFQPWWPHTGAFLAMGKHGLYVWGSVAACGLALALEQCVLAAQARRWQREQVLAQQWNSQEKSALSQYSSINNATKVEA